MAEGFDENTAPVARGRRDPELAMMLQAESDLNNDQGGYDETFIGLAPGDTIMAKVTIAAQSPLGDAWYTYASQTHIQMGETEEDGYMRLAEVVNGRVLDLASDSIDRINEVVQQAPQGPQRQPLRR